MGDKRKPLFIVSLILILLVVLMEVGSLGVLGGTPPATPLASLIDQNDPNAPALLAGLQDAQKDLGGMQNQAKPPGKAIPAMALLDLILFLITALWTIDVVLGSNAYSIVSAPATCVVSCSTVFASIAAIIAALILLLVMVSLLLAIPFGTLVYLALYGFFNRGGAAGALSLIMTLKIAYTICLVLAQPDILRRPSIILLVLTSFLANIIVSFLHGFVPIILVSITDDIAAIVCAVLALIWAIVYLIGSIGPTFRVVKSVLNIK